MRVLPKVRAVANHFGISFINNDEQTLWTGSAINLAHIRPFQDGYSLSNTILHEIAHYATILPEYRKLRNFGWCYSPDGPKAIENTGLVRRARSDLNFKVCVERLKITSAPGHEEEKAAQILTYLAMYALELPGVEEQADLDAWDWETLTEKARQLPDVLIDQSTMRPRFLDGIIPGVEQV